MWSDWGTQRVVWHLQTTIAPPEAVTGHPGTQWLEMNTGREKSPWGRAPMLPLVHGETGTDPAILLSRKLRDTTRLADKMT